jgi:hypothetical protein
MFYFSTERGKAGYANYTKDFNRLIWQLASPRWAFDDTTFERAAKAFENPDFVHISLHNYRWYMPGARRVEIRRAGSKDRDVSNDLFAGDHVGSDANGAAHADPSVYAKKYVGKYEHRLITGGRAQSAARGAGGGEGIPPRSGGRQE